MPVAMLQSMPQPLPENAAAATVELADAGAQAVAAQGDQGLNILQLILHASLPVQLVMALLLLAVSASAFGLSCAGVIATATCTQAGAWSVLNVFIAALVANQATYLISPRK